ncbi:gliding motility-associated C-terminal domain-containing protein [Flavobacterium sp. 5]|uniref:gliding motility-associated C-terminal domain-containing protein n=1 Tax=Flavobacterium sp. 5 TaxID=2035199 RepID=UPI0012FD6E74|nr:gliding motility-associated C-terminal domain-containing protein [Flavobacterium sp. 5]
MKIKLLLILLITILLSNKLIASNLEKLVLFSKIEKEILLSKASKNNPYLPKTFKRKLNVLAVVNPPIAVAGSSCGPGVIALSATGASGDIIEWFSSQTSATVLATGNTYSPNVATTTTFYVSARSGIGTSTRVPVVASVYNSPPAVFLSSNPLNNTINPLCSGTSVTFTATGGADLFEFSVDGVVKQSMSTSKTFTTSSLTNGQIVSVRSRYAITLDGNLTDNAWGTAPLEDNVLSAPLATQAVNGYINALKISPTEDKLVFGIAGKALNYRRIMVFLDTKPGGFNVSNYGDENGSLPDVRAFNYFNNNPSTFDSYFEADYCLAIATDTGETNYYADVIELKTGNSTKTYLGTAATGSPTAVMGVNKNNSGTSDYNLGFEVEVSKALVGYTTGDVKFFAFTMQDNTSSNYNVTNSFLSPSIRTSDYGSGAIDYNLEVPNPVVVAEAALTPCYSTASLTMNFVNNPTLATVGGNQTRCSLTSEGLGGNTPSIGTGVWALKSGPGIVTFSDSSAGNATATVSVLGTYVFTWTISSGQCSSSSADVTVVYNVTDAPTGSSSQNFCKLNSPKISDLVAVGNNIEWFATAVGGIAINSSTNLVTGSYFAEQTNAITSCKSISRLQVDVVVDNPAGPTVATTQTFCNSAKISNLAATGTAVKWYAAPTGGISLDPNTNLVDGETYYATQTVSGTLSCESFPRTASTITINITDVPTGSGLQTVCNSGTIADLLASGIGIIKWYDNPTGGSLLPSSTVLVTGTTYYASQTIGTCESATRYPLTVTINDPNTPISGGNQSVCATNPLQTLTANATVSLGTVVWYDALLNGNIVTSPILNTIGSVTYYAQNNIASCSSISRTAVVLEIKDSPFLNVTSKSCSLDLLTYKVDFTVASGSTITRFPVVGVIVGNSITSIPTGTDIMITADKGNGCVETFNVIAPICTCSVINNPVSGGDKSICEGQSTPVLSASVNGGETIDWYANNSSGPALVTGSLTYTPTVTLPGVYTYYAESRKTVDGCLSSSRTAVSLTINAESKPSGQATQIFCESQNATVVNLVASGTGIKWYADAIGGVPLSNSTALIDSEDYYASQTGTTGLLCESVERLKVVVTINKPSAPTTTVTNPVFCNSATVSDLIVTGTNVKWYDSLGTLLSPSSALADGIYSATQTISGCESVSKLNVTVTINKPSAITINGSQTFCESESATVASLTAKATFGANIKWYSSATGTIALSDSTPLINALYYGSQTVSGCESTPRVVVNVTINAPSSPVGDGIQLFCSSQSAKISNLNVTGSAPIVWYNAAVLGSSLSSTTSLSDGTKYYATQTISGCESVNRFEVSVTIVDPLTPTISSASPLFCESQNATLNSIALNGIINNSNVIWYDTPNNGIVLPSNTLIVQGSTYYVSQQSTTPLMGCESINRLAVSPIIDKQQAPTIDSVIQPTCALNSGSVLFSGLPTIGNWTIIPSIGSSIIGSGANYSFVGLTAGTDYTFKVTNANGCTSVLSTIIVKINAVPTAPLAPTISHSIQPSCAIPTGTIVITPQQGMEYSLDGVAYQSSTIFEFLSPNDYTLYVRNIADATCTNTSVSTTKINSIPTAPVAAIASSAVQPTCAVPSGSITITTQSGMEYSLDGTTYQLANMFNGLAPNDYTLYVRNIADATCTSTSVSTTKINAIPTAPVAALVSSVVQPTCGVPSGSITITTQSGMEYSLDGTTYQLANMFNGLAPNDYTLYVRNIVDATCTSTSVSTTKINAIPTAPIAAIASSVVQPTCAVPSGSITITTQSGMEYSLDGTTYQLANMFNGLAPNDYTLYVRNIADATCTSTSVSTTKINAIPTAPVAVFASSVVQPTCGVPSGSITITAQSGMECSLDGTTYQLANMFNGLAPNDYTLYVRNITDATCTSTSVSTTKINAIPTAPVAAVASSVVQPTCGVPSGTITITTQSGMEYSLDGTTYQLANMFNGLAPNDYTLYVRNITDATCTSTSVSTTKINAIPTAPVAAVASSVVQPTCGVPSGTITITTQSGMEYSLDGTTYQLANMFNGLAPNDYTLYVRNITDATCTSTSVSTTKINVIPTAPVAAIASSVVQPTCAVPSGSITITTQSGMEYSLDGTTYQLANMFNGLAPNDYTLYVRNITDATCTSTSVSTTKINAIPTAPVAALASSVVQPTCGVPSGTITITTQSGMEYSLDGTTYQLANMFNGLAPNDYTLYVRNITDATCTSTSVSTTKINVIPTAPVAAIASSVVQPTCAVPSGSITITTQSGMEYSLDGTTYQLANMFNGLAPNDYTLYVRNITDATCTSTSVSTTKINAIPTAPVAALASSVVQPTCGVPSGTITITTQSGMEYSLDGTTYQLANMFNGLAPNDYTLYVRNIADATCTSTSVSTTKINAIPTAPVAALASSVVQPTCGLPSGSITITTQSGMEYSLDGTTYQLANMFNGLAPNDYTLYVRNITDATCTNTSVSTTKINAIPTAPVAALASSVVQPTCAVPSGSITITAQSGMEYSLDGTTYQLANMFNGLTPNDYTLYVRNIADATCTSTSVSTTKINSIPTAPVAALASSVVQPTCGLPSGSITITAKSGMEYSLDGTTYQLANMFNGLTPNDYTLYVRNIADATCTSTSVSTTKINSIPTAPVAALASSVVQPTCGLPSGSITITTQSGMEYSLDGTTYQLANMFNGLTPNDYTLYVRNIADATCTSTSVSTTKINSIPTAPVAALASSVVQPTCGLPSGSITITAKSGMEYSLDGTTYQLANMFNGLTPNDYTLYVRNIADATCTSTSVSTTKINSIPTAPVAALASSVVQPTCGLPSGSITITTQSGMEYSLDGTTYQLANMFNGLTPNDYTLYVRNIADATCTSTSVSTTKINSIPTAPVAALASSVVQPTCGLPSGSITITAQSGMEYSLDGTTYQLANMFNGLTPNDYTLYVRNITDATCTSTSVSTTKINAIPTAPVAALASSVVQPTCGLPSGSITITAQSGMEYSLDGTTYQLANMFNGLTPNDYTLYVRNIADATCTSTSVSTTKINSIPTAPVAALASSVVQPTCGLPSGSITITAQSGMEYSLDGTTYQLANMFNGLTPNDYTLYVRNITDATCTSTSVSTTKINAIPTAPVAALASSVVQPTCGLPSGSITITAQSGMEYSLDGTTYQLANMFNGLTPNDYTLYVRNIADATCTSTSVSTTKINAIPTAPVAALASSVVQPTCGLPSGSITITAQSGMEYSLDGTTYQLANMFNGLAPNDYTLYVRNIADATCTSTSVSTTKINSSPPVPDTPVVVNAVQPTCAVPVGRIEIGDMVGVDYSIGNGFQDSPEFLNVLPANYIISVRFKNDNTCVTTGSSQLIQEIPPQIQFESSWTCKSNNYEITASPLLNSYDPDAVNYIWKDNVGNVVSTNSNVLNVNEVVDSTSVIEAFPLEYSLTVKSNDTGCETTSSIMIESIYCDIQKGISPDGNGSNDFFDLRLMNVKKLEIFNRYGLQVYSQGNYTDQWIGQTNSGEALPSATYYYVIAFNNGQSKTGWIYLIREK